MRCHSLFSAHNGAAFVANGHISPLDGSVGFGVGTFSYTVPAITVTHFILAANAVPKPTAWALMASGFGIVGAAARGRARATRAYVHRYRVTKRGRQPAALLRSDIRRSQSGRARLDAPRNPSTTFLSSTLDPEMEQI